MLAFTGAIRDQVLDEETLAYHLMIELKQLYPEALAQRYKFDAASTPDEDLLETLARKRGFMASGGRPDIERAVTLIISEFRNGILGRMTLERPGENA